MASVVAIAALHLLPVQHQIAIGYAVREMWNFNCEKCIPSPPFGWASPPKMVSTQ